MRVVIAPGHLMVTREFKSEFSKGDPKFYSESILLHHIKLILIEIGYDVIKKLMWKDGHMVAETQHYIRSRKVGGDPEAMYIWDGRYNVRNLAEDFNNNGEVVLDIVYPNQPED